MPRFVGLRRRTSDGYVSDELVPALDAAGTTITPGGNMKRFFTAFAISAALLAGAAAARADDLKIALIHGRTGPLEAYAKQTETGLRLGFEYATKGTMEIDGRKIVIITKDDQGKPDLAKSALTEAYEDDGADIAIGTTSSPATIAMLPIAEEHKKILIVEPAVADQITGDKWNRYIFRTGRNSSQDAISNAVAIGAPGVSIAVLGVDNAFGRDGVAAFKTALAKTGATLAAEGYHARHDDGLHRGRAEDIRRPEGQTREKIDLDGMGRRDQPARQARRPRSRPLRHRIRRRGQHSADSSFLQALPRPGRRRLLLLRPAEEPDQRLARRRTPEALQRAAGLLHLRRVRRRDVGRRRGREGQIDRFGEADLRDGRDVRSRPPKERGMIFPQGGSPGVQSMYAFKIKVDPDVKWAIPELVRELKIEDMDIPIRHKR